MVKVYSITSGKGGVGKTNITANLAVALSNLGQKVLILDADIGLANIDIVFGIKPKYTIADVISGEKKIRDVIVTGPQGVRIIPASSGVSEIFDLTTDQKVSLLNAIDELNEDIDVFLIDTGAGISTNVMYFNIAAQEIIVIVNKEPTSITDGYALMKVMSEKYSVRKFNLLVNSVKTGEEASKVYNAITSVTNRFLDISVEFFGYLPYDENLQNAVLLRTPVVLAFPQSQASKMFNELAKKILKKDYTLNNKGNIQFFWQKIIELSNQKSV